MIRSSRVGEEVGRSGVGPGDPEPGKSSQDEKQSPSRMHKFDIDAEARNPSEGTDTQHTRQLTHAKRTTRQNIVKLRVGFWELPHLPLKTWEVGL